MDAGSPEDVPADEICVPGDCPGQECLPGKFCADASDIAYVASDGSDDPPCPLGAPCPLVCSHDAPCQHISVVLDKTPRSHIVLLRGMVPDSVVIDDRGVWLLAGLGGATLTGPGPAVVTVTNGGTLTAYGLQITQTRSGTTGISGPRGSSAATVTLRHVTISGMSGFAVDMNGGTLALTRSLITGNPGGGLRIDGTVFEIVNNVFERNGTATGPSGAIMITSSRTTSSPRHLEFNTLFENQAADGAAISCVDNTFTARNNLLVGNGNAQSSEQTTGTCQHQYSVTYQGEPLVGTGNGSGDPKFRDAANGDFHIPGDSAAARAADPGETLADDTLADRDGTVRIPRASCGAYEAPGASGSAH